MQFTFFFLWIGCVFFSSWFWKKKCRIFKPFKVAEKTPPTTVLCVFLSGCFFFVETKMDPPYQPSNPGPYRVCQRSTYLAGMKNPKGLQHRPRHEVWTWWRCDSWVRRQPQTTKRRNSPPKMVVKIVREFPPKITPKTCRFSRNYIDLLRKYCVFGQNGDHMRYCQDHF